jgi:hypothetical protein
MLAVACVCLLGASAAALSATPPRPAAPRGDHVDPEPPGAAAEVRGAAADARHFLDDYLRYLHGRLSATRIRCVAARLRAELAAAEVHASTVARRRPVRIAELHTQLVGHGAAHAWARVLDGADATLTITLALHRTANAWEVRDVGHR